MAIFELTPSGVRPLVFGMVVLLSTGCSSNEGSGGPVAGAGIGGGAEAGAAGSSSGAAGAGGVLDRGGAGGGGATSTGTAGTQAAGQGGVGAGGTSAGAGGAAGSSGSGGMAGGGGGSAGGCQRGQVAANEVLIVGDSYFPAAGGELVKELRRLSGANYRDRSVGGAKMNAIVAQYENAGPPQPKVVIMDGGGNDILQNPGCEPGCAQHVQAVTDARNFFAQMATDGVSDVVFIFYYDMPVMKAGLDWMRPKMAAECEQSPVPCHFVDNQPLFAGMDASTYTTDGIHPTVEAADKIARQVWDRMQQDCVAQ